MHAKNFERANGFFITFYEKHFMSPHLIKSSIHETFAEIYLKELSTDIDKKAFLHSKKKKKTFVAFAKVGRKSPKVPLDF
jgi:hypothetical protein